MPSRNVYVTPTCQACGDKLPPGRARAWCSDACRQAGWRRRHQLEVSLPELPARAPKKPATVYECPVCEERLLGVQRCEGCGAFMRRLGLGGMSPCCAEPVTFDELLGR